MKTNETYDSNDFQRRAIHQWKKLIIENPSHFSTGAT